MRKQYGGDIHQDVDVNTQQIQELQQEIRDLKQRVQQLVPEEVRQKARTNFQTLQSGVIAQNREKQQKAQQRVEQFQGVVHERVGVTKGLDALEQQQKDWDAAKTSSSPASCKFSEEDDPWCQGGDLAGKGYQHKDNKGKLTWCCPPGINQPMPEGSEGDLLGLEDDYGVQQPSQSVTPTSQSAPTVDLLDAEPQFTGKTVDVPSEKQEEQQNPVMTQNPDMTDCEIYNKCVTTNCNKRL